MRRTFTLRTEQPWANWQWMIWKLEIQRAEIDLNQQKAELEKLFEPDLTENIASTQAKVESGRLKLVELLKGPVQDKIRFWIVTTTFRHK